MYIFNFDDLYLLRMFHLASLVCGSNTNSSRLDRNRICLFFSSLCIHLEQCNSTKSLKRGSVNNVDVEVGPNKVRVTVFLVQQNKWDIEAQKSAFAGYRILSHRYDLNSGSNVDQIYQIEQIVTARPLFLFQLTKSSSIYVVYSFHNLAYTRKEYENQSGKSILSF